MFFMSSCVGRLEQAAAKPLCARQYAHSWNTQLMPALTASLWTHHHLAYITFLRSILLTSLPNTAPFVYADAVFAAGDRQHKISDVVVNKVASISAGFTMLVNGFWVLMFLVHGQPLFFHGVVSAEVLAEFALGGAFSFLFEELAQILVLLVVTRPVLSIRREHCSPACFDKRLLLGRRRELFIGPLPLPLSLRHGLTE